jgi:hypothetical protein
MSSVFWDARGIILERLNDEIKKKRQCTVSQINQNDGKIA